MHIQRLKLQKTAAQTTTNVHYIGYKHGPRVKIVTLFVVVLCQLLL